MITTLLITQLNRMFFAATFNTDYRILNLDTPKKKKQSVNE